MGNDGKSLESALHGTLDFEAMRRRAMKGVGADDRRSEQNDPEYTRFERSYDGGTEVSLLPLQYSRGPLQAKCI